MKKKYVICPGGGPFFFVYKSVSVVRIVAGGGKGVPHFNSTAFPSGSCKYSEPIGPEPFPFRKRWIALVGQVLCHHHGIIRCDIDRKMIEGPIIDVQTGKGFIGTQPAAAAVEFPSHTFIKFIRLDINQRCSHR